MPACVQALAGFHRHSIRIEKAMERISTVGQRQPLSDDVWLLSRRK